MTNVNKHQFLNPDSEDIKNELILLKTIRENPQLRYDLENMLNNYQFSTDNSELFNQLIFSIDNKQDLPEISENTTEGPYALIEELTCNQQSRQLQHGIYIIQSDLRQGKIKIDEAITAINQELANIVIKRDYNKIITPESIEQILVEQVQKAITNRSKGISIGIPTGFEKLDKILGGFQTGIHLLSGQPGAGKTTFSLNLARNAASKNEMVLFVSFEETSERLIFNTICGLEKVSAKKYREGFCTIDNFKQLLNRLKDINNIKFITANSEFEPHHLNSYITMLKKQFNKERILVIIDYLQRWSSIIKTSKDDYRLIVAKLASDLREIALSHNIPILIISSQNRLNQGKASLTSFKESGDLEYSADSAMFLTCAEGNNVENLNKKTQDVNLDILKNRYGEKTAIKLIYYSALYYFEEIDKKEVK